MTTAEQSEAQAGATSVGDGVAGQSTRVNMVQAPEMLDRQRGLGWRNHLIGLALCVAYVSVLLATAPDVGMSRDEGMYVTAGEAYGGWLAQLWHEPSVALERDSIDRAFRVNREHPPLMKMLFGLGHLAQERWHLFSAESSSFRFAGMLSAGLLVWLIYIFGTRAFGRAAGLFAALAYALLPRPFYHSHLNAFDVPITLANTAVIYAYYRSLSSRRWGYVCGALFGLALLTKHNSWLVPGILAIHFACVAFVERRGRLAGLSRVSLVPHALIACFTIGPLIFFCGWPFLWHDTFQRIGWYVNFHFHHEYYNMEYFGVNYFWPPFPMSYAWVMTFFTVPLTILLLAVLGMIRELGGVGERVVAALRLQPLAAKPEWAAVDARLTAVLMFGAFLAPLAIITLPSTPIFGGTKHWFPAYPFMALFAGRMFSEFLALVTERWPRFAFRGLSVVAGAFLLAPSAVETAHSHPFGLSHYTVAAGGVPGAAQLGMNRQFWGFTTRSLVPYLRQVLPNGGSVYICDTIYTAWLMLMRDGFLPENIRAVWDIAGADYALVHHEKHFAEIDHQIWTTYGSVKPAYVLTYDGVPIISVYRNPRIGRGVGQ
jgi:4-amino-4-deoxy-L-arabinose transferase-like glycosyltransferase